MTTVRAIGTKNDDTRGRSPGLAPSEAQPEGLDARRMPLGDAVPGAAEKPERDQSERPGLHGITR